MLPFHRFLGGYPETRSVVASKAEGAQRGKFDFQGTKGFPARPSNNRRNIWFKTEIRSLSGGFRGGPVLGIDHSVRGKVGVLSLGEASRTSGGEK